MTRRAVAWATVVLLLLEAVGMVLVNAVLATVVGRQHMSLAGLDPDAMVAGAWIMAGIAVFWLALCCAVVLRVAIGDCVPGRAGRILLIGCAIVQGVAGALTVGLVGWAAFGFFMCVLGLLVQTLQSYERGDGRTATPPADRATPSGDAGNQPADRESPPALPA